MKVPLATGSSRGLGKAIALELASRGFKIAVHYSGSQVSAEAVAEEIKVNGGEAQIFQADLSNKEAANKLVAPWQKPWAASRCWSTTLESPGTAS